MNWRSPSEQRRRFNHEARSNNATEPPEIVATMRRYLEQIACVLRPGSVTGADLALRSFAAFLVQTAPEVTSVTQVTRRHIEDYKPWLAKRPGQNRARLTTATLAHRLGTLRMFFVRIDEWGWEQAPTRVPMFPGDLPRQDHPLPKALDDTTPPPPKANTTAPGSSTNCSPTSRKAKHHEQRPHHGSRA